MTNPPPAADAVLDGPTQPGVVAAGDGGERFCPWCGYNLHGLAAPADEVRCPECGLAVDLAALRGSNIPWEHRQRIGRWRAYWRTLRLVTTRPSRLAAEVARPVDPAAAVAFQRVTGWLIFVPVAALAVRAYGASFAVAFGATRSPFWMNPGVLRFRPVDADFLPDLNRDGRLVGWLLEWSVVVAFLVGAWLCARWLPGVTAWFFRSRRLTAAQQARATAVARYTAAPLALLPLTGGLLYLLLELAISDLARFDPTLKAFGRVLLVALVLLFGLQLLFTYLVPLLVVSRATDGGPSRTVATAVLLPLAWAVWAAALLLVPAGAAAFVAIVVLSFR